MVNFVLSVCVCMCERETDIFSDGGKGSAGGARPVLKCNGRWRKLVGLKVLKYSCNCGSTENSSSSGIYVEYN